MASSSLRNPNISQTLNFVFFVVFFLCSLWPSPNKCAWNLPKFHFIFLNVCQPDNSRHLIKGLVKCFIQQYLCYINYSYSTTLDKSHFDYTVIFPSIHLPDRDHGRSEEPQLWMDNELGLFTRSVSSTPLSGGELSRAFVKIKYSNRCASFLNGKYTE